jgi:hypothetical protein
MAGHHLREVEDAEALQSAARVNERHDRTSPGCNSPRCEL